MRASSNALRPSSDIRKTYPIYNSFTNAINETGKDRKRRIIKQMQALAGSNKWSESFLSSSKLAAPSTKLYTPAKSRKSLSKSRSLTKSKSKSC